MTMVFSFFLRCPRHYFNVDFCRTGDSVSRQKDARIGYSGWWVTIVVLIPVTGVICLYCAACRQSHKTKHNARGMTHHFLRHAFH